MDQFFQVTSSIEQYAIYDLKLYYYRKLKIKLEERMFRDPNQIKRGYQSIYDTLKKELKFEHVNGYYLKSNTFKNFPDKILSEKKLKQVFNLAPHHVFETLVSSLLNEKTIYDRIITMLYLHQKIET